MEKKINCPNCHHSWEWTPSTDTFGRTFRGSIPKNMSSEEENRSQNRKRYSITCPSCKTPVVMDYQ